MKKENLWRVLGLVLVPVITCSVLPLTSCKEKKLYRFEGHTFNSINELMHYAESNLVREVEIINHSEVLKSSLDTNKTNGNSSDSFHQLQDQLNLRIEKTEVDENNLEPHRIDEKLEGSKIKELRPADRSVYRSVDNQTLVENENNLKDGKYSYCLNNQKEGVFYRNQFYENMKKLETIIKDNPSLNGEYVRVYSKDANDSFYLYSPAIFLERNEAGELKNEESIKPLLNNFLETSLNIVYEVDTNGQKKYYSDINEVINQVRWPRDEYLYLPKNNARSAYVFDIKKNIQHDYYGPYASSNEVGVKQIQNQKLWHAVPKTKSQSHNLDLQKENALISEFFNLLVPDININPDNLFNIVYLEETNNEYRNFMLKNAPEIWEKVLKINEQLNRGQRKSILLKLPVMYTIISEEIVKSKLNQECIVQTNRYFTKILELLNQIIRTVFPEVILQNVDKTNSNQPPFDLLLLFEETDPGKDNSLASYQLNVDRVKKHYPHFLDAVKVGLLAMENCISLNGHFPYEPTFISSMLKISNSSFEKLAPVFKKIWKLFSSKKLEELTEHLTLTPAGLRSEQISVCLVEHILLMNALSNAFEQEYQLQSKRVLADPKNASETIFFKNLPNARELITTAGGDYGIYFLLRRRPELVARIRRGISPTKQELASLSTVENFFDLISSSLEIVQKIVPSLDSFTNLVKKLAIMASLPSLQKLASQLVNKFGNLSSELVKSICVAFCDVSNVVSELVNLIRDAWPNASAEPIDKVVYHFLDSDYFIDNNRFYLSANPDKVNYNEQFLKQLLSPIKISDPRMVSLIYLNNKTYPANEEGWRCARYEGLHQALFHDRHKVANVRIFYSLNASSKIVSDLNSKSFKVDDLVNQAKLYVSRQSVYEKLINYFNQSKNKSEVAENIIYLTEYENSLLTFDANFENTERVVLLPSVNEDGYLSFCPLQKVDFKIHQENQQIPTLRYLTLFEQNLTSNSTNQLNSIGNDRQQFDYLLKKLLQENQPAMKKINQDFYRDKIDELNKILAVDFDLIENQNLKTVFKVWDDKNQKEIYFFDQHDAVDYLIKSHQLQKNTKTDYKVHLVYDRRKVFDNLASFHKWVKSEMTTA